MMVLPFKQRQSSPLIKKKAASAAINRYTGSMKATGNNMRNDSCKMKRKMCMNMHHRLSGVKYNSSKWPPSHGLTGHNIQGSAQANVKKYLIS